jgi:hypothetical protein
MFRGSGISKSVSPPVPASQMEIFSSFCHGFSTYICYAFFAAENAMRAQLPHFIQKMLLFLKMKTTKKALTKFSRLPND